MITYRLHFTTPLGHNIYRSTTVDSKDKADHMGAIYQQRNYRKQWVFEKSEIVGEVK